MISSVVLIEEMVEIIIVFLFDSFRDFYFFFKITYIYIYLSLNSYDLHAFHMISILNYIVCNGQK